MSCRVLVVGLLCVFCSSGCKDAKPGEPGGASGQSEERIGAGPTAQSDVSHPVTEATVASSFQLLPLEVFYQRQFADYLPTESWAQVPRGETNFDGVPFLMFGKFDLTGLGRARDGEFRPATTGEIPIGRRASRLHLMHGATYDSPDTTPVACIAVCYESGETQKLFIRYGVHVRNWYVEANEIVPDLTDPNSRVVWTGNSRPDGTGKPTRLFKTTFGELRPTKVIRTIEVSSLFARANAVILAITFEEGGRDVGPNTTPDLSDEDDAGYRREDVVRAVDADNGKAVPNPVLKLSVTEGTRTYGFGVYRGDSAGKILIVYPPAKFSRFMMDLSAVDYAPIRFEVESEDGRIGPDLQFRLKRLPAP